ncbi:MAG: Rieske 2Fe-2S domain-containing protein [Hyphomicrobiales bacterium]|nr:Rieske 2Fe-2S domain-containing protein [Hyphomicrobiales bacterium]
MSISGANASVWDQTRDQLAAVTPPSENSPTLPPACYTDASVFDREIPAIFQSSWVGIGRADRWESPGDYTAFDVAGVPIIVLRDLDGVLRAFANTCRHRGSLLLEGSGNCRAIRCPFHGWGYRLDGRLAGAPRMETANGFDKDAFGLLPFRTDTKDGFAFVCLDETVTDLDHWLGDFSELHEMWSLGDLVTGRRREFEVHCNWKAFLEVFNEYYHLPYVHPNTLDSLYELPDDIDHRPGNYVSQFGTTKSTTGVLEDARDHALPPIPGLKGRNRNGTRYTWMFPNMTFAAGSEAIWAYDVYPTAPDRTRVSYARKLVTGWSGGVLDLLDAVLESHSLDDLGEVV